MLHRVIAELSISEFSQPRYEGSRVCSFYTWAVEGCPTVRRKMLQRKIWHAVGTACACIESLSAFIQCLNSLLLISPQSLLISYQRYTKTSSDYRYDTLVVDNMHKLQPNKMPIHVMRCRQRVEWMPQTANIIVVGNRSCTAPFRICPQICERFRLSVSPAPIAYF